MISRWGRERWRSRRPGGRGRATWLVRPVYIDPPRTSPYASAMGWLLFGGSKTALFCGFTCLRARVILLIPSSLPGAAVSLRRSRIRAHATSKIANCNTPRSATNLATRDCVGFPLPPRFYLRIPVSDASPRFHRLAISPILVRVCFQACRTFVLRSSVECFLNFFAGLSICLLNEF